MLHRTQQLRINPGQPRQRLRIQAIVFASALPDQPYVTRMRHDYFMALRPFLKRSKLWAMVGGFLLLHGTIGALVISRVERIPLIWYVPVDAAEISVLIRVLSWAFAKEDKPQSA